MKPVTVDMLRAHLMVASLTAMCAEVLVCLALLVLPVSQDAFGSTSFRMLAVAAILGGVLLTRQVAHMAFDLALQRRHATLMAGRATPAVTVDPDCPRRWLVVLHLRLSGRPFVLALH
ncbi:hypothetical protein [Paraburkholderia sp. BCC1884]|uniref:hypothetical protein n=1 Tax=Paraburkholderia sp. BCC1884 TaxID=2562668 RepID=UPI0011835790|nr:hypothetical protein [Paraburkholderia sp. BCC1884]